MKKKRTPKTKRMTLAQFQRRCLEAYARFLSFDNWKQYSQIHGGIRPCHGGRASIKAAWLLPCLLISTAFSQVPIPDVAYCRSTECYVYQNWYQVIALPAPPGHLKEFTVLARERQYAIGLGVYLTHMEPTLHLSIYPNNASISVNGMMDNESPTIFSQNFTTNNGLVCERLTNQFLCADLSTNLWRLKVPLNIRVYPGAWFGVWFTYDCRINWTIPPLQSAYGNPMQACRYHIKPTVTAYYFQPLISGVPYAVYGKPQLQITRTTNGVDITWGTNDTNLWLTSSQGRLPLLLGEHGSGVSLPATNVNQIFWLTK